MSGAHYAYVGICEGFVLRRGGLKAPRHCMSLVAYAINSMYWMRALLRLAIEVQGTLFVNYCWFTIVVGMAALHDW